MLPGVVELGLWPCGVPCSGVVPGVVVLPGFVDVPGVGDGLAEFGEFAEFGEVASGVGEAVPGVGDAVPGVGEAVPGVGDAVLPEFGVAVPGLEPVWPGFDIVPGVSPLCAPAPVCPAFDPVEEPALDAVDPAEPADPAEPDCPVSATTQHVKSKKTATTEIFVFMGPPASKESNANSRSAWSLGSQFSSENPVDALGSVGQCGRNSFLATAYPIHESSSRQTPAGKPHPTVSCLPGNVAAQL